MNTKQIPALLASLGVVAAVAGCATAQEGGAPAAVAAAPAAEAASPAPAAAAQQPATRRSGGHSKNDFFNTYDMDGDGVVTLADFVEVRDLGYRDRDADGDSKVVAEEYVAEYTARLDADLAATRKGQISQAWVRFEVLDKDKDGILTREEFQATGKRMFDRLDTNEDGIVDSNDTKAAY